MILHEAEKEPSASVTGRPLLVAPASRRLFFNAQIVHQIAGETPALRTFFKFLHMSRDGAAT
jgi:hypothetical protein